MGFQRDGWGRRGGGAPEPPDAEVTRASLAGSPGRWTEPGQSSGHGWWGRGGQAATPTFPPRRHFSPQTGLPAALSAQSTSVLPGGLTSGTRYLGGGGPGGDWEGPEEPGRAMNSQRPVGPSRCVAQGRLSFLTCVLGLPGTSGVGGPCTVRAGSQGLPGQVAAGSPLRL